MGINARENKQYYYKGRGPKSNQYTHPQHYYHRTDTFKTLSRKWVGRSRQR